MVLEMGLKARGHDIRKGVWRNLKHIYKRVN